MFSKPAFLSIYLSIAAAVAGFTVGAMTGLSNAPVISGLLAGLFSLVAGALTLASVVKTTKPVSFLASAKRLLVGATILYLTVFLLFINVGVAAGIYVKSANWFLTSPYLSQLRDIQAAGFEKDEAKDILEAMLRSSKLSTSSRMPHFSSGVDQQSSFCFEPPYKADADFTNILPVMEVAGKPAKAFSSRVIQEIKKVQNASTSPELVGTEALGMGMVLGAWLILCENNK